MGWRSSENRKRHQSLVNKTFRNMNKSIAKDALWRGRFVIEQNASYFLPYGDGGHYLVIDYQFRDKKTGRISKKTGESNALCMWNGAKLFYEMNDFITNDCYEDVWANPQKNIYEDTTDYTLIL